MRVGVEWRRLKVGDGQRHGAEAQLLGTPRHAAIQDRPHAGNRADREHEREQRNEKSRARQHRVPLSIGGRDGRLNAVHDQLVQLGAEVGLPFAFDKIARAPNTLDAHRLIRWAAATGAQGAVVDRLFRAYFVEGRDIGDRATLLDIAAEHGLDRERVARLLEEGADVEAVRNEISEVQAIGVTGVPFFIFAGRLGVPGAQDVSVLRRAIAEARAAARTQPAP